MKKNFGSNHKLTPAILVLLPVLTIAAECLCTEPEKSGFPAGQLTSREATTQRDPNGLAHLIGLLRDPNASVRSGAATALGKLDDVRASLPLVRLAAAEKDPNVLRSVAVAFAMLGAARGDDELMDSVVDRLMDPVPDYWKSQGRAEKVFASLGGASMMSTEITWSCFSGRAGQTPVNLSALAGGSPIKAWANLIVAMNPKENAVLIFTPRLRIIPLPEAIAWHQKVRQLPAIREARYKLASATEKGRIAMDRLKARASMREYGVSLVSFVIAVNDATKLQINVDWEDLRKYGYKGNARYEFSIPQSNKPTIGDSLDDLEFREEGVRCALSFIVEPDGSITIATRDTITKRVVARARGK